MTYVDLNAWLGTWPFRCLRDNEPTTLVARLRRAGIERAAVSQIEAILHRDVQPANERLAESVEAFGDQLLPMATINPRYPFWEHDLRACHEDLGMRGVRLSPCYHDYAANGPEAVRVAGACVERGLPMLLAHRMEDGRQRHWLDPGRTLDLGQVAELIAAVPEATVVVTNARGLSGSALWQRQDLRERNWYFDMSLAEVHYVLHSSVGRMSDLADFIDAGGAGHLVFGTHTPFSYPSAARVKAAVLPVDASTLARICSGRATDILGTE
jgi:uncharacterized protein